ncbi:MAG TPA: hypothetical protein VFH58_02600 [Acidimicrobiales bacterium]|nr:hypothetical protein [Acidimicrobiales bacterium]
MTSSTETAQQAVDQLLADAAYDDELRLLGIEHFTEILEESETAQDPLLSRFVAQLVRQLISLAPGALTAKEASAIDRLRALNLWEGA